MLITNANLITYEEPNRILADQALLIVDGCIADMGANSELLARYSDVEKLDAHGQYVMPGNICAHTHFYSAFARGMAIAGSAPEDFSQILQKLWWPLDLALDEDAIRYSAYVCLIDAIRHGTTTLIDHHSSPNAIPGSLDLIADVVDQAGLRAVLCYEVTDRNGSKGAQDGIKENLRFIERCCREKIANGRVAATFGLHASLTLSDQTLKNCRELCPDHIGFHIHVAESEADQYDCLAKSGTRVVDRLALFDMLGPRSIFVHAVHVDAREIQLLSESGTWVTHQPRSNMNNAVGIGQVEAMLRAGVRVGLGNDGFSNAMWEEAKMTYLAHKLWNRDPRRMSANDVFRMAVYHNAALASTYFPLAPIGILQKGAHADLILVDYHPYTPVSPENLPWHIVFGFHESMITTTMVAGRILMRDRILLHLDEKAIAAQARRLAPEIWDRYQQFTPKE